MKLSSCNCCRHKMGAPDGFALIEVVVSLFLVYLIVGLSLKRGNRRDGWIELFPAADYRLGLWFVPIRRNEGSPGTLHYIRRDQCY